MPRLSWTINLTTGPAVGEHTGDLEECISALRHDLRDALTDWTPDHETAFRRVAAQLRTGRASVAAPAFIVTLED